MKGEYLELNYNELVGMIANNFEIYKSTDMIKIGIHLTDKEIETLLTQMGYHIDTKPYVQEFRTYNDNLEYADKKKKVVVDIGGEEIGDPFFVVQREVNKRFKKSIGL